MPTAVVTGAGQRLGLCIAETLLSRGCDLHLCVNRSRDGAEGVAEKARQQGRAAHVHQADLSDLEEVRRLAGAILKKSPVLDVVVHNAGLFEKVAFGDISVAHYRRMLAVNVDAPFFLSQALLPALQTGTDPSIVHITDIGSERPLSGYAHYSVSKAGLDMLSRALAVELAPTVRVNAVAPGTVMFPEDYDEKTRAQILKRIPLQREGRAEDIASAVAYLALDAPYVTGHVLRVDGGRFTRL